MTSYSDFYYSENTNDITNNKENENMMTSNSDFSQIASHDNITNNKENENMLNESLNNVNPESSNFELAAIIPHCPVVLVLDTSHSMWGKGLTDMKNSLIAFYNTLDTVSFNGSQIDIAAVSMGDRLGMIEEFTPFADSLLPQASIRPKGYTPMAAALALALEKLQTQVDMYEQKHIKYVTPQMIILSDGDSSDDITDIAADIRKLVSDGKLFVRTIAMGEKPLLGNLRSLGGELVEPAGELPEAFEDVGQRVSMVYEVEVVEDILDADDVDSVRPAGDVTYIIDGCNMLYIDKYRSGVTMRYLLSITDYMDKNNIPYQVFFDASTRHRLHSSNPAEVKLYEKMLREKSDRWQEVAAGTQADAFILKVADMTPGSVVLSNDLYRDYRAQYFWLKRSCLRRISGSVIGNQVYFPEKSLLIPVSDPEKLV